MNDPLISNLRFEDLNLISETRSNECDNNTGNVSTNDDGVDSQVTMTNSISSCSEDQSLVLKPLTPILDQVDADLATPVGNYGALIELTPNQFNGSTTEKETINRDPFDPITICSEGTYSNVGSSVLISGNGSPSFFMQDQTRSVIYAKLSFEVENKINELVTHETNFVQSLKSLYNSYIVKMSEDLSIEKPYFFYVVKECIGEIKKTHYGFLNRLSAVFEEQMKSFYPDGSGAIANSFDDFTQNRAQVEEYEYFHNISKLIIDKLLTHDNLKNYLDYSFLSARFQEYLTSIEADKVYIARNLIQIKSDYSIKRSRRNEVNAGFTDIKIDTSLTTLISKPFNHMIHLNNIYLELRKKMEGKYQCEDYELLKTVETTSDKIGLFLENLNEGMKELQQLDRQKNCFKDRIILSNRNKFFKRLFEISVDDGFKCDNIGKFVSSESSCVIYKTNNNIPTYKNMGLVLFENYLMVVDCINYHQHDIKFCIPLSSILDFHKDDDKFYESGEITTHHKFKFKLFVQQDMRTKGSSYELVFLFESLAVLNDWFNIFERNMVNNKKYRAISESSHYEDFLVDIYGFDYVRLFNKGNNSTTHLNVVGQSRHGGLNKIVLGDFRRTKRLIDDLLNPDRKLTRSSSELSFSKRLSLRKIGSLSSFMIPEDSSHKPEPSTPIPISSQPSIHQLPSTISKRKSLKRMIHRSFSSFSLAKKLGD